LATGAVTCRDHPAGSFTGSKERIFQVEVEDLVPSVGRHVEEWGTGVDAGVVHPDVEAAHIARGTVSKRGDRRLVIHLDPGSHRKVTDTGHLSRELLGGREVAVRDDHMGASIGQPSHDAGTGAAGAASHNGHPTVERHELLDRSG